MKEKTYYDEAKRYMDNAKESLSKTTIKEGFYEDKRYVKQAAGIAYAGLEKSARWWLRLRGYDKKSKNNYEIVKGLATQDTTIQKLFNSAYDLLHQDIYYGDNTDVDVVKLGFARANEFILLLKGYNNVFPEDTLSNLQKRQLLRKKKGV